MILAALLVCALAGCIKTGDAEPSAHTTVSQNTTEVPSMRAAPSTAAFIPEPSLPLVPELEVELVAKTLRGECYDDQPDDKREVVKVICNRVSDGRFGDSIEAVITAPHQFQGFRLDNVPSANDYEIAREVLAEWYGGGCAPLGEYLFFSSGGGRTNVFRKKWR